MSALNCYEVALSTQSGNCRLVKADREERANSVVLRLRRIRWNDAALAIDWPVSEPLLSDKDAASPFLADVPADRLPVYSA